MIWVLVILLLLVPAAGVFLLFFFCGRQRGAAAPEDDPWLETVRTERVRIDSDDELELHALLVPRKGAKGTVLLFHNARSSWKRDFFPWAARFYHEKGYQLLLADQRAHGASRGRWTTWGIWERFDVRGWTNYVSFRFGDAHPMFLTGKGMGAAAVLMASSLDLPGNVRGIVADSPYDTPYKALWRAVADDTPLPAGPLLWLLNAFTSLFIGFRLKEYGAVAAVKETRLPILLLQGPKAPKAAGREIAGACAGDCALLRVEDENSRAAAEAAIAEFLEKHLRDEK